MYTEPKFKPGDRVVFRPQHGNYEWSDRRLQGLAGTIQDLSDLPTLRVYVPHKNNIAILCADQRDLELVRGSN